MRPILIRLMFDQPWTIWAPDVDGVPGVGLAFASLVVGLLVICVTLYRRGGKPTSDDWTNFGVWGFGLLLMTYFAPKVPGWFANAPQPFTSLPIFGYGAMVLLGFLAGTGLGQWRARRAGIEPLVIFDLTFWTLIFGVLGGRLFYIIQHGDIVFAGANGLAEHLLAAVNLSKGGLVLIGAMLGGAVGFFGLCYKRGIAAMPLLDLLTPSIFIGEGFGRLGCLLYGCCFGDPTTLPWGVQFGPGSAAFDTLVNRGFVLPSAAACMPLHPTQVYMSLNAFLLAFVTWAYYRRRRFTGDVFVVGIILYSITRFLIEFVRADELGQLGTGLTISQLLSLGLATVALVLQIALRKPVSPTESSTAPQTLTSAR